MDESAGNSDEEITRKKRELCTCLPLMKRQLAVSWAITKGR